jgi:hypothetical protein
MPKDEDGCPY